jgi:nucleoside-diphosphate-sugar epimerase
MRALVTGCAGFIGSHITETLLADGVSVTGIDCFNDNYARPVKLRNLEHHAKDWDQFEFVPMDLSVGELDDLVSECDVVFHLAAEPGVRASWGARFDRYVRNNIVATQHLLDALRASPEKRLVYASSSSVYGDAERFPTPEDVVPQPRSPYGATKLTAEHLCGLYAANYGVQAVSLRYFTVYGPRQRPDMAFNRFCAAALKGETLTVYGDGLQTRDFTYVDDIVAATIAAGAADVPGGSVYNLGGGSQTSVREVLDLISELSGRALDVAYTAEERGDVRDTSADTSKARAELGFAPATAVREGLASELEWLEGTLRQASAARR